jgi:putative oxidoreductase
MALTMESGFVRGRKDAGFLPIRAALGASMLYHGVGKLKEESREQTGQMFEQIGIQPGKAWAIATGAAEVFAGACALLGVLTRPAALAVLVTQGMAIAKVHAKNGFDITKGGYEFNVALMAIAAGLMVAGPGLFSLHEEIECLAEGRGAKKMFRKARPNALLRALKYVK